MPYVIRNSVNSYSTGGQRPWWVELEKAKVWKTIGQVKRHLGQFCSETGDNGVPPNWEVLEVRLAVAPIGCDAMQLMAPTCIKRAEKMAGYRNRREKEEADREKQLLKRLKKKYEGV